MGDADTKFVSEEKSKKKVSNPQVETCFKKPDHTIKKDIGLSRHSANKVVAKAPHQKNQENARNAKSKEKTAISVYGQLPQKQIGANQGKIRKDKSKENNVFERLYPKPFASKLTSDENKRKNSKKSSVKRTGSFDRDPVKNSETIEGGREFLPDLEVLNELVSSDTSERCTQIPLRKLSFVVDPKDSIFFNSGLIISDKRTEPTRKFMSNSADLYKVDTKDSFLEQSPKTKNDVKTSIFDFINGHETKSSRTKEKELLNHRYDAKKVSSLESQTDDEELLADILKSSPISKGKLVVDKEVEYNEDCNGEEESLEDVLKFFPILKKKLVEDKEVQSSEDCNGEEESLADILKFFPSLKDKFVADNKKVQSSGYCNFDSEDSLDDDIVLYTRDGTKHRGRCVTMFEDPARLEPSLDEILRQEEIDPTQKKGIFL